MGKKNIWLERCTPAFFVSVASKGFSLAVSPLFATLARRFIGVAAKGVIHSNRVGAGQRTAVSEEKNSGSKSERGDRAGIGFDVHKRE
jgi:hypothetical protein